MRHWKYYVTDTECEIRSGASPKELIAIVSQNIEGNYIKNAALIAAAPEVLALINDFTAYYENGPVDWETIDEFARKFITIAKKAEGVKS